MIKIHTKVGDEFAKQLFDLHKNFFFESRFNGEELQEDLIWGMLKLPAEKPESFFIAYLEDAGKIVGYASVIMDKRYFSTYRYATDLGVYLIPEYRGKKVSKLLIEAAETWAKENGAKSICLGVSAGINIEAVEQVYARFGYNKTCSLFEKEF
jgi:GNAT superfamily N-acetyltransferase